jgi:dolichol-phosphate mannosyltransferase
MQQRLIIVPTYNEAENIEALLQALFTLPTSLHVLVVDDNSPDGTADLVKTAMVHHPKQLFILERKEKNGLGKAYLEGFQWALRRNYTSVFEMDADFSHDPHELPALFEALEHADVVVGSRYCNGINVVNWPLSRIALSYFASIYVRLLTGMPVKDPTAGFVGYRREVLEAIDLNQIRFVGYAFQIEMKFKAYKKKFKIKEVSIVFKDREKGYSKMSSSIIKEGILGVIQLKFNSIFNKKNF